MPQDNEHLSFEYINFEDERRDMRKWVVVQMFITVADTTLKTLTFLVLGPARLTGNTVKWLAQNYNKYHSN